MARFRHLPTEVEAIQWDGFNKRELQDWCGLTQGFLSSVHADKVVHSSSGRGVFCVLPNEKDAELYVAKSGAWCLVELGDFVVKERDGSGFYPCTGVEFLESYEPVPPPPSINPERRLTLITGGI